MSVTHIERVTCSCGTALELTVADSLNAMRHPHLKQALVERSLHVFECGVCRRRIVVEGTLLYFDFDRTQFLFMYPRAELARAADCADEVRALFQRWMLDQAPGFVVESSREFLVRVCFGYEELREKVVIDDARLSDLVVEALKLEVLTSDPWFEEANVLTLRLEGVTTGELAFVPEWRTSPGIAIERKLVTVSRATYDELSTKADEIRARQPALARGAHVSFLRLVT